MTVFNLPDLGEGLPDAEVVKWLVAEGDAISEGDLMVEMSTAKAVVEVPSPFTGKIVKLHGGPGDLVNTGEPLVTFAVNGEAVEAEPEAAPEPKATPKSEAKKKAEPAAAKPKKEEVPASEGPASEEGGEEIFLLPDLGEGLPDAEIVQWLVAEGDAVTEGETMIEMSTAKAVVEVPAPFTGVVARLYGGPGDVIDTGKPLIAIRTDGSAPAPAKVAASDSGPDDKPEDGGAVVGELIVGTDVKSDISTSADGIKASPVVRATAKKLKVDLASVKGSGGAGEITVKDVRAAAGGGTTKPEAVPTDAPNAGDISGDIKIGPAARALAAELGVDLATITPSGPRGAICKKDVLAVARALIAGDGAGVGAAAAEPLAAAISSTISSKGIKAAPKVRALAREKGVDLASLSPSGPEGSVTIADVNAALQADFRPITPGGTPVAPTGTYQRPQRAYEVSGEAEKLIGPRRVMAHMMAKATAEICHTPIFDEVDISAWPKGTDITVRIMRAIVAAAMTEPAINAWYDHTGPSKTIHKHVSLGMAVDSPRGLFVPVLKNLDSLTPVEMRAELDRHRKAIGDASITAKDMSGATITLSNYGMMAGKFAAPIISAPEVAIVGIGGLYDKLVMDAGVIENHRFMPVSLTFDHRGATGGEAARFLRGLMDDLQLAY